MRRRSKVIVTLALALYAGVFGLARRLRGWWLRRLNGL